MLTFVKNLYRKPVVKATVERVWRGGIGGLVAGFSVGAYSVNDVVTGHHLDLVWQSTAGGAVAALLLALGVSKITGSGPAINTAEQITTK